MDIRSFFKAAARNLTLAIAGGLAGAAAETIASSVLGGSITAGAIQGGMLGAYGAIVFSRTQTDAVAESLESTGRPVSMPKIIGCGMLYGAVALIPALWLSMKALDISNSTVEDVNRFSSVVGYGSGLVLTRVLSRFNLG